jgi:hypothetical protein
VDGRGGLRSPELSVCFRCSWLWALWERASAHAPPASGSPVYPRPVAGAPGGCVGLRCAWKRDSGCGSPPLPVPSCRRAAQRRFTASRLLARVCYGSTLSEPLVASLRFKLTAVCHTRLLALAVGFVGVYSSVSAAARRVFIPHTTRFRRAARPRWVVRCLEAVRKVGHGYDVLPGSLNCI